jgi:hypothetical protein
MEYASRLASGLGARARAHMAETAQRVRSSMQFLGLKFLLSIVAIEHVLQGFIYGGGAGGIVGLPILFLLRSFGTLTASRIQILRTIAVSPWAMKPIFGIVSDVCYIDGQNKLPFIGGTLVTAIVSCVALVFAWSSLSPAVATVLFFMLFLQIAVADLLLEAKYADKVRERPDVNPDLASFVQLGQAVGQLLSLLLTGLLIALMPLKYMYLLPIVPFALTLYYPVCGNWIEDGEYAEGTEGAELRNACGPCLWYTRRADPQQKAVPFFGVDVEKARANWRVFLLGLIIVGIALVTNVLGLLEIPVAYLFGVALASAPLMIVAFFALVDRRIAMIQTFSIIQNMCTVPLEGALFFFFTDNAEAYPEGPHFSDTFYITGIGVTAALIYIVSIVLYNAYMTRWNFRTILVVTNLAYIVVSLPNLVLFLRLNRRVSWLPDWLFVLGTEAMQVIIGTWCTMPLSIMMNQLCPKGVEATSYALLAGCINLGNALSQYQGAFVLDVLGVRPMGRPAESHQFDNLWQAALISVLLPLLPIASIFFLIPNTSQSESILEHELLTEAIALGDDRDPLDIDCELSSDELAAMREPYAATTGDEADSGLETINL